MPEQPSHGTESSNLPGKELELSYPVVDVEDPNSGERVRMPFPSDHITARNDDPPVELAILPPTEKDQAVDNTASVPEAKAAWKRAIKSARDLDQRSALIDQAAGLAIFSPDRVKRYHDELAFDRLREDGRQYLDKAKAQRDTENRKDREALAAERARNRQEIIAIREEIKRIREK